MEPNNKLFTHNIPNMHFEPQHQTERIGLLHTPAALAPEPMDRSLGMPHSWSGYALVGNQTVVIQPECSLTELTKNNVRTKSKKSFV